MEINHYNTRARLINELTRGMELATQLRAKMGPEYSPQTRQVLLEQIISSYEKALFIIRGGAPSEQPHQLGLGASPLLPSSPSSIMGGDQTPRSNSPQDGKQCSFKRKSASTWTKQVKLDPENGLEDGPPYDGYSWRKYGQKDILGAKYPRSYYRCTYRSIQDCWATKQVQRSDEDPSVVNITYRGKHNCNEVRRSKSAPTVTLPAKQEPKQEDLLIEEYQQDSSSMVTSIQATIPLEVPDMRNMDSCCYPSSSAPPFYGDFPTCLISASTTSDSNYFSMSPSNLDTFENIQHQQQYFEGGIGDIVLGATTSTTSNHPGFLAQYMEPKYDT